MSADDFPAGTSVRFDYNCDDSPKLTRAKHRCEYYHLLELVEKQTGSLEGPNDQPAMARAASIRALAKQNGVDDPKNRLRACIERGDLVTWRDAECLRVCRTRVADLRAAIAEEDERAEPEVAKLDRLAGAVEEVQGSG